MRRHVRRSAAVLRENGLWLTATLTVVTFLGLFLVGEADAVVAALLRIESSVALVVAGLVTVSYGVRFLKWAFYLRELGIEIPTRTSLLVFFSGFMLAVTPGKVGEVWKAWFLRDLEGVPVSRTAPVVAAERVTDLIALTAFAALGVFLYRDSMLVVFGLVAAFVIGIGLLQWRTLCLAVLERCRTLPVLGDYAAQLETFYEEAYTLFRPRPIAVATGISLLAWGFEGIALWMILEGLGASAGPLIGAFVFGLGSVVGAVSFLPGGLVATEATMVGALVALGYASSLAAAATLLIRVGTLWYGVALGTVVFGVHRSRARIREVVTRKRTRWTLGAALIGVLAHVESLSYWFTSTDTIALIESSRASSLGEALTVIASPLMAGTRFTNVALFYRPLASLSYTFDYAVWGLDPTGYHLTNLLLHGAAVALAVLAVAELTGRADVGGATGVLFALHPLTAEVVPALARRHDVLMTAFWLATLWLFVRGRQRGSRRLLVGALGTYALALGAKEPALLLPGLIAAWVVIDEGVLDAGSVSDAVGSFRTSLRAVTPFVLVTGVYLAIRVSVLGGLGGYHRNPSLSAVDAANLLGKYVLLFAYPSDIVGAALGGTGDLPLFTGAAAFALLAAGLFRWGRRRNRGSGAIALAAVSGGFAALPLAVAVGSRFDVGQATLGYPTPLSKVYGFLFFGSVVAGGLLACRARSAAFDRNARNALVLFGLWLALPVGIFLLNGTYTLRSGYLFLVPAMGIVALAVVVAARRVHSRSLRPGASRLDANAALSVVAALFVLSLAATSPVFHAYDGWRTSSEVNRVTLTGLGAELEDAPDDARVVVSGVPRNVTSQQRAFPRVKSIGYVRAGTIEAWLRLQDPDNAMVVSTPDLISLRRTPADASFETTRSDGRIAVEIDYRLAPRGASGRSSVGSGRSRIGCAGARHGGVGA